MGPINVLVVDDDKLTRWSVATILGRLGYQVSEGVSFEEGAAALEQRLPELVLLDIRLPDSDGFALLEIIRQRHPNLPVLMMTAHPSPETVQRALDLGAAGHLNKPIKSAELKRAVSGALESARSKR